MLRKTLKYDLEFIYKNLIIFYSILIVCAIIKRIFDGVDNSTIFDILSAVANGFVISFICSCIINTLMRSWVRFQTNLYGDQSYLTHTLPVEKKTIYASKFWATVISMFTSVLVILVAVWIAYYSKENLQLFKESLKVMAEVYDSSVIGMVLTLFFLVFLQMTTIAQAGNTGLLIGYRFEDKKLLLSVVFGFASYFAAQTISLVVLFGISVFNKDLMNLFITNEMPDLGVFKFVVYIICALYMVFLIAFYLIDLKLFKKGVNVD